MSAGRLLAVALIVLPLSVCGRAPAADQSPACRAAQQAVQDASAGLSDFPSRYRPEAASRVSDLAAVARERCRRDGGPD